MERQPVSSSNLASVGYDPDTQTLEIEFIKNGDVYEYYNVPVFEHEGLMTANSKGTYFDVNIKKGGYSYRKL